MSLKKLFLSLVLGLIAHNAWASSDNYCEPYWSLYQDEYNRCSSLPILSPGNDTRVNLKLLLVDDGFAALQAKPVSKEDAEFGYGKVPFTMETFEKNMFLSQNRKDGLNNDDESAGYGGVSRCVSNDVGKTDFIDALEHSKDLSMTERQMLTENRKKLNPTCIDAPASKDSGNLDITKSKANNSGSPAFNQFSQYLAAATAFYEGRYEEAESAFAGLIDSNQPWLKESSRYMLGRTGLNRSQQNAFDSEGFPKLDKVDKKALQDAETAFNNYLKDYPSGRYASSARGLLRRIYWLSNQQEKLAAELTWQLNHPKSPQHNLSLNNLALEADHKLLVTADPKQVKDPLLLAVLDLSLMRRTDSSGAKRISFSDLREQQSIFAGHKALYEYLLAAHRFYVQKDAANTLKALPGKIPQKMSYLDFSRLILRGQALEATKDHLGARKLWLSLLPIARQPLQAETLQLALALNYEHGKELESAFKPDSPITETAIRNILLRNGASADLLRRIIRSKKSSGRERHIAIYTLLYKDLLQGHYQNYIQDHPLLPKDAAKYTISPGTDTNGQPQLALFTWSGKKSDDNYGCPSTLDIAKALSKNAKDPYGLICLGDFVNSNELESGPALSRYSAKQSPDAVGAVLGKAPSHFPGILFSRGEGYKTVIANAHVAPDLKAYALYRSIQCYAPTGINHCGGNDVAKTVRKSWFQTLKTRYANSVWAKSLKYYW